MIKPRMLRPGDRVAAVTLSWGGPGQIPGRYEAGKRQFEAAYQLEVVEMPHTLRAPDWVAANPEARAADLMAAFADSSIAGIVSAIGARTPSACFVTWTWRSSGRTPRSSSGTRTPP